MEKSRKHLTLMSALVLIFSGIALLKIILELCFGDLNNAIIPEGAPENILLITKIVLLSVTGILLLPKIYIGVKGLWVAKNPASAKGHIILAIVIFFFVAFNLVSPIVGLIKMDDIADNVASIAVTVIELVVYFEYIKYAFEVSEAG